MKRLLAAFVFLLSVSSSFAAANSAPSYIELADAPIIIVDWSKANAQAVTLHGNRSLVFENGQKGGKYLLIIKQDDTGSRVPTWPASVHWPGITPPTLTTTAHRKDYLSFFCDGVTYDGLSVSQNF